MATFNNIKQKLIDRVYDLASTSTASNVSFLAKALDQIESNPKNSYKGRVNLDNAELNEGGLDRETATQSTSTTEISPLGGGIHREQQTRSDGEMGVYTNYQNYKGTRDEAKPQFAIWSAHNNYTGGSISYDQYFRPYERRGYKSQGGHYYTGGDGGDAASVYSGHQKAWGAHNNHCWYKTTSHAGSSNTTTSAQHPSRTDALGEVGHYRIKMGHGGRETSRFHDYGNAFRYENIEVGSCDLDHRQTYMKYQGHYVHLREKWMPGTHVTWASHDSWFMQEFRGSPSMFEITHNEAQAVQKGYGTISYNKTRQEFTVINQLIDSVAGFIMKVFTNIPKIDRVTALEDVFKEENAVYVYFTWGTGWSTASAEAQRSGKITMTDDGQVYATMMNINTSFNLGIIDNTWRVKANQDPADQPSNKVYRLIITKPGKGYTSAPVITIANPTDVAGTKATGTVTVTKGRATNTTVVNGGSHYDYSVEPNPIVTVDNGATGGTGMEIKAVLVTIGTFTTLDSFTLNSPTYGRDSGPYGQRIVMSRNKQFVYMYCQYYGLGTGIRSWIIDKKNSSFAQGESYANNSHGIGVVAFGEEDFYIQRGDNWDGADSGTEHQGHVWYQIAPHDGTSASWKRDEISRHMDLMAHTTTYPCVVPIF
jgi:hypothetical protein